MGHFKDSKFMKYIRIILYATLLLTTMLIMMLLLNHNNFFTDFKSDTFNEVITPFATIFAVLIYFYTLMEIKKQSKTNDNSFKYNYFKEKILEEKLKLEKYSFRINVDLKIDNLTSIIKSSNGIVYYNLYYLILSEIEKSEEYIYDLTNNITIDFSDNKKYIKLLNILNHINYEIFLNNINIESIIREVNESELSDFQKKSLNEIIITNILNDYLMIFYSHNNNLSQCFYVLDIKVKKFFNEILYKPDVTIQPSIKYKELNLHSSLKSSNFDRLNNYIIKNKILK